MVAKHKIKTVKRGQHLTGHKFLGQKLGIIMTFLEIKRVWPRVGFSWFVLVWVNR